MRQKAEILIVTTVVILLPSVITVKFGPSPACSYYWSDLKQVNYDTCLSKCAGLGQELPIWSNIAEQNFFGSQIVLRWPISWQVESFYGRGYWTAYLRVPGPFVEATSQNKYTTPEGHDLYKGAPFIGGSYPDQYCLPLQYHGGASYPLNDRGCSETSYVCACQHRKPFKCDRVHIYHGSVDVVKPQYDPPLDKISVTCDDGYENVGSPSLTCASCTGEWAATGDFPKCVRKLCPKFESTGASLYNEKRFTVPGNVLTASCDQNFYLSGNPSVMCSGIANTAAWKMSFSCETTSCTAYTPLTGQVKGMAGHAVAMASVATLTCPAGEVPTDPPEPTCTNTGLWSTTLPFCAEVSCRYFDEHTQSVITYTDGSRLNSVATKSCTSGVVIGPAKSSCLSPGRWNSSLGHCYGKNGQKCLVENWRCWTLSEVMLIIATAVLVVGYLSLVIYAAMRCRK